MEAWLLSQRKDDGAAKERDPAVALGVFLRVPEALQYLPNASHLPGMYVFRCPGFAGNCFVGADNLQV